MASRDGTARVWDLTTRSAMAVLVPGAPGPGSARPDQAGSGSRGWAAAVASPGGTWHGISEHGSAAPGRDDAGGRIWLALGLARQPLPPVPEAEAEAIVARSPDGTARPGSARGR